MFWQVCFLTIFLLIILFFLNKKNLISSFLGKLLKAKRKHLYWTPCAAHCIDLMLEDIGKIPRIKKTIERAIFLVGYIYNHTTSLNMLRSFPKKHELVKHAITRFATSILTVQRIHEQTQYVRYMFASND